MRQSSALGELWKQTMATYLLTYATAGTWPKDG